MKNEDVSGFEDDLPYPQICRHPGHQVPSHMVIPQGKRYRHVCPACGFTAILRPPQVTLSAHHG